MTGRLRQHRSTDATDANPHRTSTPGTVGAPTTPRLVARAVLKLSRQDSRRPLPQPNQQTDTPPSTGRTRGRPRVIIPEQFAQLASLSPNTTLELTYWDDDTFRLHRLHPPGAGFLLWHAERILSHRQALARLVAQIQTALAFRAPYAELHPTGRWRRRRIETQYGIPRDYPHQTTDRTDPT